MTAAVDPSLIDHQSGGSARGLPLIDEIAAASSSLPPIVLVHGAFHGGWVWRDVARRIRARGREVFIPTFTGMGERVHLMSPDVDAHMWIQDVVNLFQAEDLFDAVLVGHSFGGGIIGGVADLIPDRIRHLVYLDASVWPTGRPVAGSVLPTVWAARLLTAFEFRGTRCFPPPAASSFDVVDADQANWTNRHLTPMPVRAYESVVDLRTPVELNGIPKTFVLCTNPRLAAIAPTAELARVHGWIQREIATGHNAMTTAPDEVAAVIAAAAIDDGP